MTSRRVAQYPCFFLAPLFLAPVVVLAIPRRGLQRQVSRERLVFRLSYEGSTGGRVMRYATTPALAEARPALDAVSEERAARPAWVDGELFPFRSRFLEIDGHRIHYADEG